jgi:hypothetical protein
MNAATLLLQGPSHNFNLFKAEPSSIPSPSKTFRIGQNQKLNTTEELALAVMDVAIELKPNSLVLVEQILFKNCLTQYILPILEDVSGLKHGQDFWLGLRAFNKVAFWASETINLMSTAEEALSTTLQASRSMSAIEEKLLEERSKLVSELKNDLVGSLRHAGIEDDSVKILLQGTQLQALTGTARYQRLQAIERLANTFPNLEIHDPYLEEEGDLNALGLHLTLNFSGNYDAVINLSSEPIFSFYTADFYSEICAELPVLIGFAQA